MSVANADYGNLENNENLLINVKWHINDLKNNSGSQEIFSDDDRVDDISCNSPKISIKNDTLNSSVISMRTPTICLRANEITPGRAVVPRTPAGLLPFVKKTSFLWTSDMETPENKVREQPRICNKTCNCINSIRFDHFSIQNFKIINKTPTRSKTPPQQNMEFNLKNITSPILGGKRKPKRKVKRKILNNLNLDLDNNNDQPNNSSRDKVASQTTSSTNSESAFDIHKEVDKCAMTESNNLNNLDCMENKLIEEVVNTAKNSNTSTQDFFSNASFTSIDKLCSIAIKEETIKPTLNSNQSQNSPKQVNFENKENISKSVSNDVLERVAAIKKNQKPIRRSIDISHTFIPKEVFSKSVIELELADKTFSQEKKSVLNKAKPLALIPFSKLSLLENNLENPSSSTKDTHINLIINDVPVNAVNNKNVNSSEQSKKEQCNTSLDCNIEYNIRKETKKFSEQSVIACIEHDLLNSDSKVNQSTDGFLIAKDIPVNQEKLFSYTKINQEMEKELLDEVNFKQKKEQSEKLLINFGRRELVEDNKTEKLQLFQDRDLEEFFETKLSTLSTLSASDGFATARGEGISISKEKEYLYMKIYNELSDDTDFSIIEKSNGKKPVVNQPSKTSTTKKTKISSSRAFTDGFATARGGEIAVSNEKEEQYLQIYNELNDIDENSLLNIKTNKQHKVGLTSKPNDKVMLTFNAKKFIIPDINSIKQNVVNPLNDDFCTARGIDIPINNDKESYYLNIYNELSDEIPNESVKSKLREPPFIASKPIKTDAVVIKKENQNVDEEFEEIGDLAEFFSPPQQAGIPDSIHVDNNFIVPNFSNILKPMSTTTAPLKIIKKEVLDHETVINNDQTLLTTDKVTKNVISLLKRKLDCDDKRTGRYRSFGGFPVTGENVTGAKLNKSDHDNESSVNQPLQKGLSVSEFFDSHSDSWLSKVDISYLNSSKINSSNVRKQKKNDITTVSCSKLNFSESCFGFSDQEYIKSSRLFGTFETFLRNKCKKHNDIALDIKAGQSITITNLTTTDRRLFLQYGKEINVKKCGKESNYELIENVSEKTEYRTVETNIPFIEIGKRKHADTDSDTPLTSVKKPRVGSELQGRKLFSDEDENDDDEKYRKIIRGENDTQPVQSMEIQRLDIDIKEEEIDLSEERIRAILQQEKIIRNKKRIKIKPTVGKLLHERLTNSKIRTSWSQLVGSSVPMPLSDEQIKQTHLDTKILEVTASNATCYTFLSSNVTGKKNIVSLDLGDGALLIFNKNGQAGVSEFSQAFLAMPGVDPKLLPEGWIENHYKWIVWKLAALDRMRFGYIQLSKNLTPHRIMNELKYRYDREIDQAQRPALRRILEKDDVSTRRMVLCISSIKESIVVEETSKEVITKLGLSRWKVEATDGWYDIPLTVDSAMANYISTGKIKEGTKIITYGAELMECERGFFPLEKPPNVSLKIHTNCTRRAKWDVKLGYQKISRPIPVKLRDIISAGGMIGEITAAAARVYPILYREKTVDGKSIYRNARCEEKVAIAHERAVERKVDAMYAEAQKNFHSKKKLESDDDSDTSQIQISQKFNHYERKQEEFKRKLESQVRHGLPPRRDVTTVLKIRLVDDCTTVILSIWGAGEESDCDIREGDTISIYNAFTSGHRGGDLHLTASRITHIKTEPLLKLPYPNRICTFIPDIGVAGFEPKFGEFDTVGVVVSSGSAPYGMKNFEMVNIAYPKPNDSGSSYLSVLFWNGISSFGYQGMFAPGSFVACSNLEWRRNLWSIAVAYCSDKSVFTGNPRQAHLMKALRSLKSLIQNPISYAESCVDEVTTELAKKPQPRSAQGTPTSWPIDRSVSFASPADHCSPGNISLQKRLDKLSRYGSSPEISPIVLNTSSARVKKDYTPVTRRKT
ncbi:uncharacterized protein LOC131665410 [Phymastichus coffea]|uniref:uncharacterized protein LOC131665410 n=1 Tax=Phymastichus coffea TaxID=108790 RepID=UPI00273B37FA|nr:uncharacterized protein LOC131665410 [Phymastichus coffea]